MKSFAVRLVLAGTLLAVVCAVALKTWAADSPPASVNVPRGIDHQPLDTLLKKYVNDQGLVNYTA